MLLRSMLRRSVFPTTVTQGMKPIAGTRSHPLVSTRTTLPEPERTTDLTQWAGPTIACWLHSAYTACNRSNGTVADLMSSRVT